jgi:hypothetical protein
MNSSFLIAQDYQFLNWIWTRIQRSILPEEKEGEEEIKKKKSFRMIFSNELN